MPNLRHPWLKAIWAKEHLDSLKAELLIIQNSEPYRLTRKDDLEDGRHIARITLNDLPWKLALIAGDFATCLRASLDHIVFQLALLTTEERELPGRVSFPIFESEKNIERGLKGVPKDAIAIIRALQPYHRGDAAKNTWLWKLNELSNLSKHRFIPLDKNVTEFNFPALGPSDDVRIQELDDGCIVSILLSSKSKMDLAPTVSVDVIFGYKTYELGLRITDLEDIYEFVANEVIPQFSCFLPEP